MILSEKESILVLNYFFGNDKSLSPNVAPHKQTLTDRKINVRTETLLMN